MQELLADDNGQITDFNQALHQVNRPYLSGKTGKPTYPLYLAGMSGYLGFVKELTGILEKGVADVDMAESEKCRIILSALCAPRMDGETSLLVAAERGHLEVV